MKILEQKFIDPGEKQLEEMIKRSSLDNPSKQSKVRLEAFQERMWYMKEVFNHLVDSAHVTHEALVLIKELTEMCKEIGESKVGKEFSLYDLMEGEFSLLHDKLEEVFTLYNHADLSNYWECIGLKNTNCVKYDIKS